MQVDDALEEATPELEKAKDKVTDPLQKEIDPLLLSTSRGHTPGPRRGAGRGRTPGHRGPTAASQPMPPLPLEVPGCWIRETSSSRLHSGGNVKEEEVNSGA